MKYLFGFFLLVGIAACNSNDSQNTQSSPRPKLPARDSNVVKSEMTNPYAQVDVSPMDIAWLPVNYPKLSVRRLQPVARVIYSRPHKQGRQIFGNLVKFGERWRLGANEATELETFIPVTIQDKKIPKGRYVLYCIPEQDKWTIVFNTNLNSWGLTLDPSKDVFRFTIPAQTKNQSVEFFSLIFQATATGADLIMAWDNVEARLPFQYIEP